MSDPTIAKYKAKAEAAHEAVRREEAKNRGVLVGYYAEALLADIELSLAKRGELK